MIDFKSELNDQQYTVVTEGEGPCLVLAGAGSGKTRTITYRVAYLLEQGAPENMILLLTFTNKASREMLGRVEKLMGRTLKGLNGGTFHKFALGILKKYARTIGFAPNFTILDSEDSKDLMKLAMEEVGLTGTSKKIPSAKTVHAIASFAVNADRGIADVIEERFSSWEHLADDITAAAERYHDRKRMAQSMDFDDLLKHLRNLLQSDEELCKTISGQFKYILVDEYQDTNKIQSEIVKLLSHVWGNILVVGDDAQSIYSFRAADINNILDFKREYPGAKIFKLEYNYRSTQSILALANSIIEQNKKQFKKTLKTTGIEGARAELLPAPTPEDEGSILAERIVQALHEGVPGREIAVLFRAAHHSQQLEMELAKRGIRYDYRGGMRFFERAHVKDALAFLRAVYNPLDEIAWRRMLTLYPGIGPATADAIYQLTRTGAAHKAKDMLSKRSHEGYAIFERDWREFEKKEKHPAVLLNHLVEGPYRRMLEEKYDEPNARIKDLEQMRLFAERQGKNLERFLAEASLQESYAADAQKDKSEDERVVLSTIHQAKGLEWERVFVINLVDGEFPNERASKEIGGMEEERRLFYVASTRAKRQLVLSYSIMGGFYVNQRSPFLDEVAKHIVNAHMGRRTNDGGEVEYVSEDEPFVSTPRNASKPRSGFLSSVEDL